MLNKKQHKISGEGRKFSSAYTFEGVHEGLGLLAILEDEGDEGVGTTDLELDTVLILLHLDGYII